MVVSKAVNIRPETSQRTRKTVNDRLISVGETEPWRRRLTLPAYQVNEAAQYAKVTTQTIRNWQDRGDEAAAVSRRDKGSALSYLQLVEVAFVAVMRKAGISLAQIKDTRNYVAKHLQSEFPFAQHKFMTDGQNILMSLAAFDGRATKNKLVLVDKGGQIAWQKIIATKFQEFDYKKGLAARWHVAGKGSPVLIDPQIAFGAPAIRGVPTWAIKGRWVAGESLADIEEDFQIKASEIKEALAFEGIDNPDASGRKGWIH